MAGHSKWAQIKHKKAATDAKKSKLFSKLSQIISLSAREKGGNPDLNSQLRAAIEKAQAFNVPKDTIERAVKKGVNQEGNLISIRYEAFGPGGVAIIIDGITDNNNRTFAEVRKILSDHDTKMAPGGALWAFEKQGEDWIPKTTVRVDAAAKEKIEKLLEALDEHDDVQEIYLNMADG